MTRSIQSSKTAHNNVESLDMGYQKLLAELNEIYQATEAGKPHHTMVSLIDELLRSVKTQFNSEAHLLGHTKIMDAQEHIADHEAFLHRLGVIHREVKAGNKWMYGAQVIEEITKWFRHHASRRDEAYYKLAAST